MIQPLRTIHRGIWIAWAVLLPALLVAGLTARRTPPSAHRNVSQLPSRTLLNANVAKWKRYAMETSLIVSPEIPGERGIEITTRFPLDEPDLLLYLTGTPPDSESLPRSSRLLRPHDSPMTWKLPRDAANGNYLVLYSLAHRTIVDFAMLENLP